MAKSITKIDSAGCDAWVFTGSRDRLIKVWQANYAEKKVNNHISISILGRIEGNS